MEESFRLVSRQGTRITHQVHLNIVWPCSWEREMWEKFGLVPQVSFRTRTRIFLEWDVIMPLLWEGLSHLGQNIHQFILFIQLNWGLVLDLVYTNGGIGALFMVHTRVRFSFLFFSFLVKERLGLLLDEELSFIPFAIAIIQMQGWMIWAKALVVLSTQRYKGDSRV